MHQFNPDETFEVAEHLVTRERQGGFAGARGPA